MDLSERMSLQTEAAREIARIGRKVRAMTAALIEEWDVPSGPARAYRRFAAARVNAANEWLELAMAWNMDITVCSDAGAERRIPVFMGCIKGAGEGVDWLASLEPCSATLDHAEFSKTLEARKRTIQYGGED